MRDILEAADISISFGGIRAVQSVSFAIGEREILGLIGPNGSGKSTCVNLIAGVCELDAGEIRFDGKKLTDREGVVERARLGMGRTFQTPKPFGNYTVYDNVFTAALTKNGFAAAREKTEAVLSFMQLSEQREFLSSKLPIEKRKWLDLARALVLEPKLIMMDECMAGLNQIEMAESLKLVRKINERGIAVLFIEHVMRAVVDICSRVIVLNEGRVLCEGEPREVLHRQEVIDAYLGGGAHA
ncbi:MAG: ABC transporter ATP-binding protein [Clostridiales bacterium]|nr:ABC transporter ATP-binding protein [Clostridiales bacterium]